MNTVQLGYVGVSLVLTVLFGSACLSNNLRRCAMTVSMIGIIASLSVLIFSVSFGILFEVSSEGDSKVWGHSFSREATEFMNLWRLGPLGVLALFCVATHIMLLCITWGKYKPTASISMEEYLRHFPELVGLTLNKRGRFTLPPANVPPPPFEDKVKIILTPQIHGDPKQKV